MYPSHQRGLRILCKEACKLRNTSACSQTPRKLEHLVILPDKPNVVSTLGLIHLTYVDQAGMIAAAQTTRGDQTKAFS